MNESSEILWLLIEISTDNSYQSLEKYKAAFLLPCKDSGKYEMLNGYFYVTGKVVIFY